MSPPIVLQPCMRKQGPFSIEVPGTEKDHVAIPLLLTASLRNHTFQSVQHTISFSMQRLHMATTDVWALGPY
jgi:hypothetical protein